MYLTFWSLWRWNANGFNNFTTDFTVSPSLATCKNILLYLGRSVDPRVAVLVDDVQIFSKTSSYPTPHPTFSPISSQVIQPTVAPTVQKTLAPTTSAISCPPIVDGRMMILSNVAMIKFSSVGMLCTLVKITVDVDSGNVTAIVPLARSYDGFMWELAAGDYAASLVSSNILQCYDHGCQFNLPGTASNEWFQLRSYQYSLPETDQLARMLERTSFGITQSDLKAISSIPYNESNYTVDALSYKMALWIQRQIIANATSHREFWRQRANPRVRCIDIHHYLFHSSFCANSLE